MRVIGSAPDYYATIQAAYDSAGEDGVLQVQDGVLIGDVYLNNAISVTINGGYDCGYTRISGVTVINGNMSISNGALLIKDIELSDI